MDKAIVAVEESHFNAADSVASTSKSFGLVKINSIAIHLNTAVEEMESPSAHEHFSIRGFVAGMRKKDMKICYPFTSEIRGGNYVEENMSPLHVPSFRWWQCSHCVPEIAVERGALEMVEAVRGNDDASTSKNVSKEKDGLSLLKDKVTFAGNRHGSRDLVVSEDHDRGNAITDSKTCGTEGQKAIAWRKDKSDCQNPFADTTRANLFQNRKRNNNSADASHMSLIAKCPSRRVDEPENVSSGSDGTLNTLPIRRKPKLRSLADIIMEERNPPGYQNCRPRSASSSAAHATSVDTETAVLSPQTQSGVHSDIAKGIKIPQTKRKIAIQEDRGSLGTNSAKRFKGQMLVAERTLRRVEASEPESRWNAFAQAKLEIGTKSHLTNVKKSKALDSGKKMRHLQIENENVAIKERQKVNLTCSANLKKRDVSFGTSFGKSKEMAPYFMGSPPGQQAEMTPSLSKSKLPEEEANRNKTLIPPRNSIIGECCDKGKVALDLSLNSFTSNERNSGYSSSFRPDRGIPDLNETFTHNTAVMRGKQLPTLSEKGSPVNRNMDISASSSKPSVREGKKPVSEMQTFQRTYNSNNNIERGASEDIPMDIVELLANNQLQRKLENAREKLGPDGINDSHRVPNGRCPDAHPGIPNFPCANRSGQTVEKTNNRVAETIPVNFFNTNKYQLDMGTPDESRFRLFRPFSASQPSLSQQRKTKYPVPNGGSDLLWPPRQPQMPFHLTLPQSHNHPFQTNSSGVPSFTDGPHKGKTVSDIKGREEKRTLNDPLMLKERQKWLNPSSIGALDPYSNDTIPAMQLLSLTNQRIVSASSIKMGPPKSFLNKTLSPCNNHPRVNGNKNQNLVNGLFFPHNGLRYGVPSVVEKNASSNFHRQIPPEQGNSNGIRMEGPGNLVIRQARGKSPLRVCTLNRNPADFSIPDASNEFTIISKDLKSRKKSDLKEKSRTVNLGDQKKQRVRKDCFAGKEYPSK